MAQYISKSALVAEIERRQDRITKGIFSIPLTGRDRASATLEYEILGKMQEFLDTIEVKEVDLKKESLTWEDIKKIGDLFQDVARDSRANKDLDASFKKDLDAPFKEILRRFLEQKGGKV